MLRLFLCSSDRDEVFEQHDDWLIERHCWRGYEPWFTLHKRRRFLGLSWWSGVVTWSGEPEPLRAYMNRWDNWTNNSDSEGGECD